MTFFFKQKNKRSNWTNTSQWQGNNDSAKNKLKNAHFVNWSKLDYKYNSIINLAIRTKSLQSCDCWISDTERQWVNCVPSAIRLHQVELMIDPKGQTEGRHQVSCVLKIGPADPVFIISNGIQPLTAENTNRRYSKYLTLVISIRDL